VHYQLEPHRRAPHRAQADLGAARRREAGLHPSNIHDTAYAIGTVDYTGDMPVILGPDGPSLGGFVCPATIVAAELWKIGSSRPATACASHAVSLAEARALLAAHERALHTLESEGGAPAPPPTSTPTQTPRSPAAAAPILFEAPRPAIAPRRDPARR